MSVFFRLLGFSILVAGLNGCALFLKEPVAPAVSLAQKKIYDLDSWRLEGRIGVQTRKDAWHAKLFWEHDGHQDRLRISGPFSQGAVSIILQDDLIYINEGNGVVESSRDPDEMLKARLGFAVPLTSLRYWVMGVPSPAAEHTAERGPSGGINGFRQLGWLLSFERFMNVRDLVLPQKMMIQGNEVKLKLIADEWVIKG
ncbi:MAG TPA: lipoprotein insertase outer membrane protein LolB [Methylococcaceae bacterium]|jgi:outer membrane lipoprotein LolB|nr:lipoprotein insertase outer membrane protein LolB [Methylococcaceae bacterium]